MKKGVIYLIVLIVAMMVFLSADKWIDTKKKSSSSSTYSIDKILNFGYEEKKAYSVLNIHPTIYLAIDEKYELDAYGYKPSSKGIVEIDGRTIIGKSVGKTTLISDNSIYEVEVTDMIVYPHIDQDKQEIPCGYYTEEMNDYLDAVLKAKVEDKGWGTRAGAVEAARFLLLQFPYKLHYFAENGRLPYVDGEGRYHHYGLYLNVYKYEKDGMEGKTVTGPAPWGCYLYNTVSGFNQTNSLDCSGFVTWALYNGGSDVDDIGAGPSSGNFDCSDLGENHAITQESLDLCKPGDLFAEDGHIAIMVGRKDGIIYIAESNAYINVRCKGWTYEELINSNFYAWVDMDEFYQYKDGKLTDYWE